jgi:hypothetical protein
MSSIFPDQQAAPEQQDHLLPDGPFYVSTYVFDPQVSGGPAQWPDLRTGAILRGGSEGLQLLEQHPENLIALRWGVDRILQLGQLTGLRGSVGSDGTPCDIRADTAVVQGEIPGWRWFGPNGQSVIQILSEIDQLSVEQIQRNLRRGWYDIGPRLESDRRREPTVAAAGHAWPQVEERMVARAAGLQPSAVKVEQIHPDMSRTSIVADDWLAALAAAQQAARAEIMRQLVGDRVADALRGDWDRLIRRKTN